MFYCCIDCSVLAKLVFRLPSLFFLGLIRRKKSVLFTLHLDTLFKRCKNTT